MKTSVARQPLGLIIATFIVMTAAAVISSLMAPLPLESYSPALRTPLALLVDGMALHPVWRQLLTVLIIAVNAIFITRIVTIYKLSARRSYLPFVMYAGAAYILYPSGFLTAILASLLLVVSSEQAVSGFRRRYRFTAVFNSAFCLGVIPLLYPPAIVLILVGVLTLVIYQRNAREMVVALGAFLLPLLLCSTGWWFAGYEWGYISRSFIDQLSAANGYAAFSVAAGTYTPAIVFCALYLCIVIGSIVSIISQYGKYPNRVRKVYIHFIVLLLCTVATFIMPSCNPVISMSITAVPASLIGTQFFIRYRDATGIAVYILFLVLFFAMCFIPTMV